MSSNVQIIDEDEQHSLKYRQPSSSNKGYFTFKNGRKTEEGIENNSSLGEMGRSVCNVAGCGFTVEGKETRILLNHLKKHQIEYAKFLSKCKEKVGKVGSVHHSVNTVKTAIKDQPTVEKKILANPVSQVNGDESLPSPNLIVDMQENVVTGLPQRQRLSELPLNSPLTLPVFLPLGTTLIVLNPSTLKIVHANSSQNCPPKVKKISSPMIVENEPLVDASFSCATHTLLKCSQPIANRNSPVDNGALAKGMSADHLNQTRSPSGSFSLARPSSFSAPIEHIRIEAFPTPDITPSPSTETTKISKTNPVTASIPVKMHEVKIVSLSPHTISFSATIHPSKVIEQTKVVVKNSSSAQPSEQKFVSQSSSVLFTENLHASFTGSEPLEPVHEYVSTSEKQPSVPEQPQQPSIRSLEQHPNLLSVNQLGSEGRVEASYERTHPVFQFFKFHSAHGKSECVVNGCGVLRNGKNPANLINHLRVKHPKKEYAEFMAKWTTMWARPKRTTTRVNVTNIDVDQPSTMIQSTRAKKGKKKNSPTQVEKEIEPVPSSVHTRNAFPVIVPDLVSTGLVAPQNSPDGGPILNENSLVGPNIHQAILSDGGNSATHSYRKDSFNEKLHPVYRYFKFREATEGPAEVTQDNCLKSECSFQGCNFTIKGNKLANLKLHLSLKHRDTKEFAEFVSLNNKYEAQCRKSMNNPPKRFQPRKRPLVQTAGNTYQEYIACRKKQRNHLGVATAVSPFSFVKGQQNIRNDPTTSIMDGQQISPNDANKAAAQFSVHTPEQELDFIGPDTPFEYSGTTTTAVAS